MGADSYGPEILRITSVEIPHGKGKFYGLCSPVKSIGSLCRGIRCKRDHSVVNNAITERDHSIINNSTKCEAAFREKALTTYCHRRRGQAGCGPHTFWRAYLLLSPKVCLTTIQVHAVTSSTDISRKHS